MFCFAGSTRLQIRLRSILRGRLLAPWVPLVFYASPNSVTMRFEIARCADLSDGPSDSARVKRLLGLTIYTKAL
jgi:hypothetical protein